MIRNTVACSLMLPFSVGSAYGSWQISGFARAEYGNGDRYTENGDSDRLGITKAAVKISTKNGNIKSALVVGTKGSRDGTTRGDINVKLAYIEMENIGGSSVSISAGLQPLLFGLKPNGFKGDRSIQSSVEYGAGANFPVARQAGPAIIAKADIGAINFRGGMFRFNKETSRALHESGASLNNNYFAQAYAKNVYNSGFYGVIGYESIFVDSSQKNEKITTVGLGWKNDLLDVSAERVTVDQSISNTIGDETYNVVELAIKPISKTTIYADYSEAEQAQVTTYRTGISYDYGDNTVITVEYSKDKYDTRSDIDSVDLRVAYNF